MTPPKTWLPSLLADDWQPAADSLIAEGKDLAYTNPPTISGADQPEATGSIQDQTRIKVYEGGEAEHAPQSWADQDKDHVETWVINIETGGRNAPERMHAARLVTIRILERHRINPHPDWTRIEEIRPRQSADYADHQKVLITVTITNRGKPLPRAVNQEEATT